MWAKERGARAGPRQRGQGRAPRQARPPGSLPEAPLARGEDSGQVGHGPLALGARGAARPGRTLVRIGHGLSRSLDRRRRRLDRVAPGPPRNPYGSRRDPDFGQAGSRLRSGRYFGGIVRTVPTGMLVTSRILSLLA